MPLQIFDSKLHKKVPFKPINPGKVGMYVCGVTVYDDTHIGHGRAYVTFDVIARYLSYLGHKVNYVRNITDIDDKIIKKALKIQGETPLMSKVKEVTSRYTAAFDETMEKLGVMKPSSEPKATEHIPEMIALIQKLLDKKIAYQAGGGIYFSIESWKKYGELSGRTPEELQAGARVEVDPKKKNPLDFALWKESKPGEPFWESPWGKGRPGWHLECSAMSMKFLGAPFDIHGGGQDLIFPHHENETAQSEAATGKEFVRHWIHNGFVTIDQQKMSKSLGNFFILKDVFKKFSPALIRYYYLTQHYRTPMEFSDAVLSDLNESLKRIGNCKILTDFYIQTQKLEEAFKNKSTDKNIMDEFESSMNDDFNTPQALALIHKLAGEINALREAGNLDKEKLPLVKSLYKICEVLGIHVLEQKMVPLEALKELSDEEIKIILDKDHCSEDDAKILSFQRERLRKEKKYDLADAIRDKINQSDFRLEDTPKGPRLIRKNK